MSPNEKSDTYQCARCRRTFSKGWSDEQAETELGENFPGFSTAHCALVCDDCYQLFMGSQLPAGEGGEQ